MEAEIAIDPNFKKPITSNKVLISTNEVSISKIQLFERIWYIYYLVQFKKCQAKIQALWNFSDEVNTMTPAYAAK